MAMKSFKAQNYYDVLGVSRSATSEEIRSAYEICRHTFQENSLATYSLFSDQENREILSLIGKAFETLFNPETRRSYDALLSRQEGGAPEPRRVAPVGGPSPGQNAPAAQPVPAPYGAAPRARTELEPARRAGAPAAPLGNVAAESPRAGTRPLAFPIGAAAGPRPEAAAPGGTQPAGSAANTPSVAATPKPAPVTDAHPVNFAREEFLKSVTHFNGAALKKARQMHGMALDEMAERSKIRRAYLEYIEEEDFQFLPAPVYVKGFVTLMATILGLPAERAAKEYMQIFRAKRPDP